MEILVMEKVNDPTFVDDFHSDKPPLTGSFHCHVWLARVVWYGEPGCWAMRCCWIVITDTLSILSPSFLLLQTLVIPVVVGYMDICLPPDDTSPSSSPIVINQPTSCCCCFSSRMARCCWTKKLKSLSKRQSLNSWVPDVPHGYQSMTLLYQHLTKLN